MSQSRIRVFSERCATCIFHPGNRMALRSGRLGEVVAHNLRVGAALVCHETTYGQRPDLGEVLCRGFFDAYGERTASIQVIRRLAEANGWGEPFEYVTPPQ